MPGHRIQRPRRAPWPSRCWRPRSRRPWSGGIVDRVQARRYPRHPPLRLTPVGVAVVASSPAAPPSPGIDRHPRAVARRVQRAPSCSMWNVAYLVRRWLADEHDRLLARAPSRPRRGAAVERDTVWTISPGVPSASPRLGDDVRVDPRPSRTTMPASAATNDGHEQARWRRRGERRARRATGALGDGPRPAGARRGPGALGASPAVSVSAGGAGAPLASLPGGAGACPEASKARPSTPQAARPAARPPGRPRAGGP